MSKANARWQMEILKGNKDVQRVAKSTPQQKAERKRQLPAQPPSWWKDGKDAAQQSMIAARELNSLNVSGKR